MGEDWCRMRLKNEADRQAVRRLIEEEKLALQQWGYVFVDDLRPFNNEYFESDAKRELARHRYVHVHEALTHMLSIEGHQSHDQQLCTDKPCMRAAFITRNDIFPAEWRISAYRSFLPEDVEIQAKKWASYIKAIRSGNYRSYLLDWYLYTESLNAIEFRQDLQRMLQAARREADDWGQPVLDTDIPDRISALSPPAAYPSPEWTEVSENSPSIDYLIDERFTKLQTIISVMHTLRHLWNEYVPSAQKLSTESIPFATRTFDEYLAAANSPDLDHFFEWLKQCVSAGMGLYFRP